MDNLFISPKFRRMGYSGILRDDFIKIGKSKGAKYCELEVLVTNPAKDIYLEWGFDIFGYSMIKKI